MIIHILKPIRILLLDPTINLLTHHYHPINTRINTNLTHYFINSQSATEDRGFFKQNFFKFRNSQSWVIIAIKSNQWNFFKCSNKYPCIPCIPLISYSELHVHRKLCLLNCQHELTTNRCWTISLRLISRRTSNHIFMTQPAATHQ